MKHQTPNVFICTVVCLRSIAGRSHDAPGAPSHSDLELPQHSRLDWSHRLGDLAARRTLIGHVRFCQDLGLSWKSASSWAGCVYASHSGQAPLRQVAVGGLSLCRTKTGEYPAFVLRTNTPTKAERLCAVWVRPVPFGFRQAAPGFQRSPRGSDIRNDWPAEAIRASFLPSQARATHYISAVSGGCRPSAAVIGTHQNLCLVGPRNTALALVRISRDHRR